MATNENDDRQAVQYGDQRVERGHGGETHQIAADGAPRLTTSRARWSPMTRTPCGLASADRTRSRTSTSGRRSSTSTMSGSRSGWSTPGGYGAHGYFENYEPLPGITRADPFSEAGLRTPVFVRFSTVAGNKGSTDLARDVRGFATKFYTRAGNWDLVGNNIPVFFIQDAIKFPDVIHAAKQEPDRGFPQAQTAHDNFWDFASLMPESTHMLMWIMSDRAIPRSFRFMEGFGVHTFRLVNAEGRSTFAKFHWKPKLGLQSVVWNEALKINGADPDFHRRDLWDAITPGRLPRVGAWAAAVRRRLRRPVRLRRARPDQDHPRGGGPGPPGRPPGPGPGGGQLLRRDRAGGVLHAERRPRHRFHQRPAAAGPQLLLPRYPAQAAGRPNFTQLPVNAPKCPVAHFQQDGHMAMASPQGRANYEPSSWEPPGPREDPAAGFRTYPTGRATGGPKRRLRPESFADHYSQARQFFVSQTEVEQQHIIDAFTFELSKCGKVAIRDRWWPGSATWTRTSPSPSPTALACPTTRAAPAGPGARPRPGGLSGAEHPGQRPG